MGATGRLADMWARERVTWVAKPWIWRLYAFQALVMLGIAVLNVDLALWLSALAGVLALLCATVAVAAYRASHRGR